MKCIWAGAIVTASMLASLGAIAAPASAAGSPEKNAALNTVINDAIHKGGSFFTPSEQALIRAKCGYGPGEWDGYNLSINNGVLHCQNGRTVDDAEVRAMLKVAQPRISARVNAVMSSPAVQAAIREVADDAARRAIENLARRRWH